MAWIWKRRRCPYPPCTGQPRIKWDGSLRPHWFEDDRCPGSGFNVRKDPGQEWDALSDRNRQMYRDRVRRAGWA